MFPIASLFHAAVLVVLTIVAFLVSALILDLALRQWYGSKVELVSAPTTGTSAKQKQCLVIYLAGIMAQSQDSSRDVSPMWLKHGNVLFVEYRGKRFRAHQAVTEVVAFIDAHEEYSEIVIIGSSMGGLLGYDVIRRLDAATQRKVVLLAIDAPTSAWDFHSPSDKLAQFMRILPFGPIWNLVSRPILKRLMVPPKDENIEPEVNREELFRRFRKTWDYPLSFYRDQVKYIITHGRPQANSLRGIKRLIYVASRRDDIVRAEAFEAWRRAFGRTPTRLKPDTTHVGYAERRKTWGEEVFTPVFERLLNEDV